MNIKHALRELVDYYQATRGIGHTLTMIHGAAKTPGVVILAIGRAHGEMLRGVNLLLNTPEADLLEGARIVGLPELSKLRDCTPAPLALDNGALAFLFDQAATRIALLEAENQKLHDQLMRVL